MSRPLEIATLSILTILGAVESVQASGDPARPTLVGRDQPEPVCPESTSVETATPAERRRSPDPPTEEPSKSKMHEGRAARSNDASIRCPAHCKRKRRQQVFPAYILDGVKVRGNTKTISKVILRYVPFHAGDVVQASDSRVEATRFRLLGLGFFRDVHLSLERGSKPGHAYLVVQVRERGTVVFNDIFLGSSEATRFWMGMDVADRNFLGRGFSVSVAFVAGTKPLVPGSHVQHAERITLDAPHLAGSPFGISASLLHADASEFFRSGGKDDWSKPKYFVAARYRRIGAALGTAVSLGQFNRVQVAYRFELIRTALPDTRVRTWRDGSTSAIDFMLDPGQSYLSSAAVAFSRDRRDDPVLPMSGYHFQVQGRLASLLLGSSYSFAKFAVRYRHWWPLPKRRHSIGLDLFGGLIVGRAPLFERFFVGDMNELLPPRALELNFSTLPSRNLFRTNMDDMRYENMAGRIAIEYAIALFRGGGFTYGADFFFRLGVFSLFSREDLRQRPTALHRAVPLDMILDTGVRLDTKIGVFTLSVGNALGRLPW